MPATSGPAGRVAFQYSNFRYFMVARFLASASLEMQAIAVGWQIFGLTHRPFDLGLVGLAQFLPGILLFLVAGHAADRFPRQRIIAACYLGFAVCSVALLALTATGLHSTWPVYAVLLGNGVVRAFNGPAGQSFVPLLVPEEHFPNAVAWNSSIFNMAIITGPVAGGILYSIANGPAPVYACAGVCYIASMALVTSLRVQPRAGPQKAPLPGMVLEGLRYIWRRKLILGAISLDLFAVLLGGAVALLPVFADQVLKIGPSGLGLLRSAPGMGALATALIVAYWPLQQRAGAAMLACVAGFGICTIAFGLSHNIVLSMASLILLGACDMVSVIVRHTMIQLSTPDAMRGRVSAVNMVFIGASNEVGQFESGLTAQWFGAVPAVILGGVGTLAIVIGWTLCFPELRRVNRLTKAELDPDS